MVQKKKRGGGGSTAAAAADEGAENKRAKVVAVPADAEQSIFAMINALESNLAEKRKQLDEEQQRSALQLAEATERATSSEATSAGLQKALEEKEARMSELDGVYHKCYWEDV